MNQIDKYFKIVWKIVLIALGVIVTIGAGMGISAQKTIHSYSGNGLYIFLLVIYWIVVVAAVVCGVYALIKQLGGIPASAPSQTSQSTNTYAQSQASQQQANETFCPVCGERVPNGNQFCPKCGNKIG